MNSLISVITINYNNLSGLIRTFNSVVNQNYTNIEYIIIDGGSVDGSKEFIKSNSNVLNYWISEPDTGVYQAMNKGLNRSLGEYVLFLNSGDVFSDEHVLNQFFNTNLTLDLYYGLSFWKETGIYWNPPRDIKLKDTISKILLPHQATFYKTIKLKEIGGFKEEFSIISDWGVFIDFISNKFTYDKLDILICISDPPGISNEKTHVIMLQKLQFLYRYHFNYIVYYIVYKVKDRIWNINKYFIRPYFKQIFNVKL